MLKKIISFTNQANFPKVSLSLWAGRLLPEMGGGPLTLQVAQFVARIFLWGLTFTIVKIYGGHF